MVNRNRRSTRRYGGQHSPKCAMPPYVRVPNCTPDHVLPYADPCKALPLDAAFMKALRH